MVVLEGERDDVPVGVLICVVPRGSIFHWACGGYVYLLHHLGLADVPGSIQPVHQVLGGEDPRGGLNGRAPRVRTMVQGFGGIVSRADTPVPGQSTRAVSSVPIFPPHVPAEQNKTSPVSEYSINVRPISRQ